MIARFASVDAQPVQADLRVRRVDRRSVAGVGLALEAVGGLHGPHDRQPEDRREVPVALVLAGHRHDRAGAVAHQHVVRDEHRDVLAVHRVRGERAGEHTGLLAVLLAVQLGLAARRGPVRVHGLGGGSGAAGPALVRAVRPDGGRDRVDQRVLRRQHHVGRAEQRVRPGREHLDRVRARDAEADLRALGAADPVALHRLDRVRPVDPVQVVGQAVGVRGDPHHPLLQVPAEHRIVAALGAAVRGDLLVRQHRAQPGAPVHRRLGDVGQPVGVDHCAALRLVQVRPGAAVRGGAGAGGELRAQLGDRAGAAGVGVVPGLEDLPEDPLGPAVERDVGGRDRPARVVRQPQLAQLGAVALDVLLGRRPRVRAGLHGVLLGGQPERVEAHRVQHVVAGHPQVAAQHVGADEAQRVPDVQPGAGRVREHVHQVELRLLRAGLTGVRRVERALALPDVLPGPLDPGGHGGVVAIGRLVGRGRPVGRARVGAHVRFTSEVLS